MRQTDLNSRSREAVNFGSILLREARTKAQENYLAGVVYSQCRVDLSCYLEPGRYRGIRAILSQVSHHVRAEVRVHEHVDAWKHRCQQHVDGHIWAAGSEPTGVAHGIVALDVWDVAQERGSRSFVPYG